MLLGTPSYLAPEVVAGARVDHRADMWAVGVMLYELLSGQRPFQAPTFVGLVYRIVHEPRAGLGRAALDLPAGLADVVARTLEKDPVAALPGPGGAGGGAAGRPRRGRDTEPTLSPQARERAVERELAEARRRWTRTTWSARWRRPAAPRRLAPSRTEVVALVERIERSLQRRPGRPRSRGPTRCR